MGPYKPLRTWVDEFIPYYMESSWELIDPGTGDESANPNQTRNSQRMAKTALHLSHVCVTLAIVKETKLWIHN